MLKVYFMRQSTAVTDNHGTYTSNDGKDLRVYRHSDANVLNGTLTIDSETNDGAYGYATKEINLEADKSYTLSAKGTTIRFYGFSYTYDDGFTEETYDFASANSTSTSSECGYGEMVSINSTDCNVLSSDKLEMNGRFAGQVANGSAWNVYRNGSGLGTSRARKFGVLNLSAGDYVTITFTGETAPTFIGNSNISGQSNGTAVVSGTTYQMTSSGNLELSVPQISTYLKSITILTTTPVLSAPNGKVFNSMVESEGLYYPKYTFTSTDDGVTFYDGDGNDITSGYTFMTTDPVTVYAGKTGRTNSKKVTFSADKVGMILANSVNCKALDGTIDYSLGKVFSSGRFDNIDEQGTAFWKQLVPGLEFNSTYWYAASTNGIYAGSGSRTVSCTVLNDNRVATFKHYDYDISAEKYDYLTSSSNSTTIKRQSTPAKNDYLREYNLYVNPSEEVSVTIGSTGYSTFSSPVPLNFAGIDGLTAFVATTVADGTVTLTSVTTAPANTGLVLKGTADKAYNIPVTNSAAAPASNLLVGCIVETAVAKDATSGFNNYVLAIEGGVAKFQSLVDNGATIPAGKAFLKNGAYGSLSARELRIEFADDILTGINEAKAEAEFAKEGKFVVDGKLVIFKKGMKFNANGQVIK